MSDDGKKERKVGDVTVDENGRKWVTISVGKVEPPQWFKDLKCPIPDNWVNHPRPLYGLTKHGDRLGMPKFPKYQFVCLCIVGERHTGDLLTLSDLPFRFGEITYYGCLNVESFKRIRDKRGEVSVVDDLTGETIKFRTDKWAMLTLYNNLGEDTVVFNGEKWRPILWEGESKETWYADDPEARPDAKEIYG